MSKKITGDKIQQFNTDIIYESEIFDDETFRIIGPKQPISIDHLEDVLEIINSLLLRAINFRNYTFRGEIRCCNCGTMDDTCALVPINESGGIILCEGCKKGREKKMKELRNDPLPPLNRIRKENDKI
jgi:hypothetical protein